MTLSSKQALSAALAAINALPIADVLTLREIRHSADICAAIRTKLDPLPGVPSSTRKVRMLECLCDYERANLARPLDQRPLVHRAILAALGAHARQAETFGAF